MVVNEASLILVEGNQLPVANTVASLAILLSIAGVSQMPKMPRLKVRVKATKSMAIEDIVMLMVIVVSRPIVGTMIWMNINSRGIQLISLKGISQGHLVIMSIGLTMLKN